MAELRTPTKRSYRGQDGSGRTGPGVDGTAAGAATETNRGHAGGRRRVSGGDGPGESRGCLAGNDVCPRPNKRLNIYCCSDGEVLCASTEHGGHTLGIVSQERGRKQAWQKEFKKRREKSRCIRQKQEKRVRDGEEMLKKIKEAATETDDYCQSVLANLISRLQNHYLSVKRLIDDRREAAAAQLELWLGALRLHIDQLQRQDHKLDSLEQTDSDVMFLEDLGSYKRLCEKHLELPEAPGDPLHPFESIKGAVDQLGVRLEAFCGTEFGKLVQSDVSVEDQGSEEADKEEMEQEPTASVSPPQGLSECNSCLTAEPTTRAHFLRYACELTLDPNTAHEDLLLSQDCKEVRLCALRAKTPAVSHPERFTRRRQLLCREGLKSERCYYEVDVHGGKAEIALAYKGINRKSMTKLSAFGAKANSWSLDRSSFYSVSHRGNSVQLTVTPKQRKVGVYLKFKEGSLSLYEVSEENMIFLYKIQAQFTEPLYPGFWLEDNCCIKICDLTR